MMIFFMTTFLMTSCTNDKSQITMKDLESNNQLLQQQIETIEKENQNIKKENEALAEEIKKKDSKIDRLMEEIKQLHKGQIFPNENIEVDKTKVLDADLNNDGDKEVVKLECSDTNYYRLSINDISIISLGENVDYDFKIVDLNVEDNIKEIAVSIWGPSEAPKTSFYRYCIGNISHMGNIEGHINEIKLKGDGSLTTYTKANVLHSWSYFDKYKLSSAHMLVNEAKEFYEMNHKVKVLKSIPLLKSTTENEMIAALTVGEEVRLLVSDNKRWCQVEKENGLKGWFEVEDFDKIKGTDYTAAEVFEGLNIDE